MRRDPLIRITDHEFASVLRHRLHTCFPLHSGRESGAAAPSGGLKPSFLPPPGPASSPTAPLPGRRIRPWICMPPGMHTHVSAVSQRHTHLALEEGNILHPRHMDPSSSSKYVYSSHTSSFRRCLVTTSSAFFRIHLCVEDSLRLNQDDGTHGACTHTSGDHDLNLIIQLICTLTDFISASLTSRS